MNAIVVGWAYSDDQYGCDYVVTRLADVAEMGAAEWCDFSAQWALARKRGWVSERADRLIMDEMRRRDADDESED